MSVYQIIVGDQLPSNFSKIPIIEAYFLFVICVSVLAVVIIVGVLHTHLRAERKPLLAMSPLTKKLLCQKLAACLCMKQPPAEPPLLSTEREKTATGDSPGEEEQQLGLGSDDKEEKIQQDWMFAAAVLDRISSIAFAIIFFGGTITFFMLFTFHP